MNNKPKAGTKDSPEALRVAGGVVYQERYYTTSDVDYAQIIYDKLDKIKMDGVTVMDVAHVIKLSKERLDV